MVNGPDNISEGILENFSGSAGTSANHQQSPEKAPGAPSFRMAAARARAAGINGVSPAMRASGPGSCTQFKIYALDIADAAGERREARLLRRWTATSGAREAINMIERFAAVGVTQRLAGVLFRASVFASGSNSPRHRDRMDETGRAGFGSILRSSD